MSELSGIVSGALAQFIDNPVTKQAQRLTRATAPALSYLHNKINMKQERKAPKDWETWADFANCYDLVLFNQAPNLVSRDNKSYDEGVLYEWMEQHSGNCEAEDVRRRLEEINEDTEDEEEKKERQLIIDEWGECPECSCEPYQWYAIAIGESDQRFLNEKFDMDIFYSEILDLYILPVYHYGTGWDYVSLSMNDKKD